MTLTFKRLALLSGAVVAIALAAFAATNFAEASDDPKADGDRHFEEKSYDKAYQAYSEWLKTKPGVEAAFPIRLRMGHCQSQLGRHEEAEKELVTLADDTGLTDAQRGRANYRLGHYYNDRPAYYTENSKGERKWGEWMPDSTYHDLSRKNAENARDRLARSAELLAPIAENAVTDLTANTPGLVEEAYNAALDAAAALHAWQYHLPQKALEVDYLNDAGEKESRTLWHHDFPDLDRILAWHDAAASLARKLEARVRAAEAFTDKDAVIAKARSMAALAIYRRGCALVAACQIDDWEMQQLLYHPKLPDFDPLAGAKNPLPDLERVYTEFHDTPYADDAQYFIGYLLQQVGRHREAAAGYHKLIEDKDFADSTETSSARFNLQQLKAQRAMVRTIAQPGAIADDLQTRKWSNYQGYYWRREIGTDRSLFKKDEHLGLWVETRNVEKFELRARTFNLSELMKDAEFHAAHTAGLPSVGDPALQKLIDRYVGETVFRVDHVFEDDGSHRFTQLTTALPQKLPPGAYIVEVDAGGVLDRRLFVITEAQLVVQTLSTTENLVLVLDSVSGAPMADSELVYKRWRNWWNNGNRHWAVETTRHKTDPQGRVRVPTAGNGGWEGYLLYAENQGRHAFLQTDIPWWQRRGWNDQNRADTRAYPMTDRPVYRPGDTVRGKIILRQRDGGEWRNIAGGDFNLEIFDPRGESKFKQTLRAGRYGALEYELPLAKDAALGTWYYYLRSAAGNWLGRSNFQVEEYKKPEFEVSVDAPNHPVKLGEAVAATIKAEYYFGGPAAGADVSYKVYRDFYYHQVYFPRRFDWLYNWQRGGSFGTPDQQFYGDTGSELITEGSGKLNESGELVIEWSTAKALADWGEYDHQFRVQAEVTDSSRRTIYGNGNVRALRRAFFAFVDNKLGYYRVGDAADVEIRTVTADDNPVQATGKLEVHQVTFSERTDEKGMPRVDESTALVATHDVATNASGRAHWREKLAAAGTFDLVFRTKDQWGAEITGRARVIVKADRWTPGSYRFGTLSLLPQQNVYTQGETAKVLLASDFRDAWMLVTVMGGRQMMRQEWLSLSGVEGQLEISVPVAAEHVPNFDINVMTVRDGEVHTSSVTLYVPPDDQFLKVEVSTDKPWYLPGDTGKFTVTVTDKHGNPASAEFAVSVYDRAITYIMPDNTPNIMKHFYGDLRGYNLNYSNSYNTQVAHAHVDRQEYADHRFYGAPLGYGVTNWLRWEREAFDFDKPGSKSDKFRAGFSSDSKRAEQAERNNEEKQGGWSGGLRERARDDGPSFRYAEGEVADAAAPNSPARALGGKNAEASAGEPVTATSGLQQALEETGAAAPRLRSDFRDSAFYSHSVITGPDGKAEFEVKFPDNLTDWRVTLRGISLQAQVGEAFTSVKVTKQLILRDQAPRFFVEGDVVTLSGIIMNRYDRDLEVRALLTLNPQDTATQDETRAFCGYELFPETPESVTLTVPAGGERRVDWVVRMKHAGLFRIRMAALSAPESDATLKDFNNKVRGATLVQAVNAVVNDGEAGTEFEVSLPEQLDATQTKLDLMLSPSIAALAIDAIPYLLEFPYGCTEQTMSRFLPAVVVRRTLKDAGISLEDIAERRAKQTYDGANPQAAYWYKHNPVFRTETMDAIIEAGLKRLSIMQRGDGGWGWWQHGQADTYMTAYVCYGLQTAKDAGVEFDFSMLERGLKFLSGEARNEKNLHRAAYIAWALSHAGQADKELLDKVFDRRDDLTHLSRAMVCMAQWLAGDKERARILVSNLEDYRQQDARTGAVWWDGGRQHWWWWNDKIETNAFVLQAFTMVDPQNKFLEPHVRWLAQNRKGSRWNSTKDTSHAVSALMAYARATGELSREYTVTVRMNGDVLHTWQVTPQNIFALQTNLRLDGTRLTPGTHKFTVEREGAGRVYFSSFCTYFSKQERLPATGNEVHIERKYYRLVEKIEEVTIEKRMPDGSTQQVVEKRKSWDRELLEHGASLTSGELVEVELGLTADNDYEYLAFEDFKPAGCEPVALRSGQGFAGGLCQNVELRDDRVAFFVSYMPQGFARLKYQLRCEIPGTFTALPTQGGSMYVPEVRASSADMLLTIADR